MTPAQERRSAKTIIQVALPLIDTPEKWCKGAYRKLGPPVAYCALGAIMAACRLIPKGTFAFFSVDGKAADMVAAAAGLNGRHELSPWNEAPKRTHAEVVEAFTKAGA